MSREVEMSQLVKYKDTRLYLQLYISIDNKDSVWQTYVNVVIEHKKKMRKQCLLHKILTGTNYGAANYCIITSTL